MSNTLLYTYLSNISQFPEALANMSHIPVNLTNLLVMRAAILSQHLQDMELTRNEILELRDTLAELPYDNEPERSRIQANIDDRKVTYKCMQQSLVGHRHRLDNILARISTELIEMENKEEVKTKE